MSYKRFIIRTVITFALFCSMTAVSLAQEGQFAQTGVVELAGSVTFENVKTVHNDQAGDATNIFSFAPEIGYFVTEGLELGISSGITNSLIFPPGLTSISPPSGSSMTAVQFFFSPSYNFVSPGATVYPFIQAKLGYTSLSSGGLSETGFSYGARGGIKIPVVTHLLISTSAEYLLITINPENTSTRYGYDYFSFAFGISGYF